MSERVCNMGTRGCLYIGDASHECSVARRSDTERVAVALERIADSLEPIVKAMSQPRLMVTYRQLDVPE